MISLGDTDDKSPFVSLYLPLEEEWWALRFCALSLYECCDYKNILTAPCKCALVCLPINSARRI
jgi:hypothetical protein